MTQGEGNGRQAVQGETIPDMRQIGLRVSDELHRWLSELAEEEHRTLNGQILHALERYRADVDRQRGQGKAGE